MQRIFRRGWGKLPMVIMQWDNQHEEQLLPLNKQVIGKKWHLWSICVFICSMWGCNPLTSSPAIKLRLLFPGKGIPWKNILFLSISLFQAFRISTASPSLCLVFLHLGFCLWPVPFSCALSCYHSHTPWRTCMSSVFFVGGDECTAGWGICPEETGWSKTTALQNIVKEHFCALCLGHLQSCSLEGELLPLCWECRPGLCLLWGSGERSLQPSLSQGTPQHVYSWKSCHSWWPWHAAPCRGQLVVAQHHPFPAALLDSQWLSSTQWWSVGLQEKGEISMHVTVPLGPIASRSHNSPFLCAILMPLLFLISSHYVDLRSSAFLGQKEHSSFPCIFKTMLCSYGESLRVH